MKLVLAFLAEHVIAHDDGKFYALGGGLERITSGEFPTSGRNLALLVRLAFEPDEAKRAYTLEIAGFGPDGKAFLPTVGVALRGSGGKPDGTSTFQFAHQLSQIRFPEPGQYHFSVRLSGIEVSRLDLSVETARPSDVPPEDTLSGAMRRAYEAFTRGDLSDAERILTIIVEQFPDSAEGHNNLGFIQLAGGNPNAALKSFLKAEEIGFSPAQILRANIGCCRFLLGDSNSALGTFSSLVGASFAARGSVLVALGRDKFQIVPLSSPTDFVVLMALNAARCALALGRVSEAQTFVNVSMAGDFSLNAATQSTFARLRAELIEDLRVASEPRPHQ